MAPSALPRPPLARAALRPPPGTANRPAASSITWPGPLSWSGLSRLSSHPRASKPDDGWILGTSPRTTLGYVRALRPPPLRHREPPGGVLDHLAGAEQSLLVERLGDELQPERRALPGQPRRHRNARQPGHIDRHREDVLQVHRDRVARLLAERKGWRRRRWRQHDVDLAPGLVEVALDERAHLLRLEVVGVVVARREHVGADQDAPADLAPE